MISKFLLKLILKGSFQLVYVRLIDAVYRCLLDLVLSNLFTVSWTYGMCIGTQIQLCSLIFWFQWWYLTHFWSVSFYVKTLLMSGKISYNINPTFYGKVVKAGFDDASSVLGLELFFVLMPVWNCESVNHRPFSQEQESRPGQLRDRLEGCWPECSSCQGHSVPARILWANIAYLVWIAQNLVRVSCRRLYFYSWIVATI